MRFQRPIQSRGGKRIRFYDRDCFGIGFRLRHCLTLGIFRIGIRIILMWKNVRIAMGLRSWIRHSIFRFDIVARWGVFGIKIIPMYENIRIWLGSDSGSCISFLDSTLAPDEDFLESKNYSELHPIKFISSPISSLSFQTALLPLMATRHYSPSPTHPPVQHGF